MPGGPDLVKPNDEELCQLTGQDTSTVEGCIQAAQSLRALGAGAVAVSRGKDGVLVVSPQGVYQGRPPRIQVVNTVGCGDSMVAGFATGFAQGWELPQVIRYAVAISAANALTKETYTYIYWTWSACCPRSRWNSWSTKKSTRERRKFHGMD